MFCEGSSDIAPFTEHPGYSNFKMYGLLILVFYFYLPLFTQNVSVKVIYSWKFRCSAKGAVVITSFVKHPVFSSVKMYSVFILLFLFFLFFCHVSPKTLLQKLFFQKTLGAPRKEQWYCFFRGAPCILVYSLFKMLDVLILVFLFWFATINPNCMCKSQVFLNF